MTDSSKLGGISRRRFIKQSVVTGAALAGTGLFAPAVRAQNQTIRIGYVTPQSGALAGMAEADPFTVRTFRDLVANGIDNNGQTYGVELLVRDSQSDSNRAAEVARELIVQDGIDLMVVASTPDTTNPVSSVCEAEGVACISTMAPWDSWYFSRQADPANPQPFYYTYHFFWGLAEFTTVYMNMWNQLETNRRVGAFWPNDPDGNAFANPVTGFPPILAANNFQLVDPGRFENGISDFSALINQVRDCDIITGLMIPPDMTTFWLQARQQGLSPIICSMGRAILFPSSMEALGPVGHNLSSEVWWSPSHPFVSSLTGATALDLANQFTQETGRQWTQPIGFIHALFEVAYDVIRRAADPKDPDSLVEAIAATDMSTIVGPVQFGRDNLPPFAQQNVSTTPLVGGQWRLQPDNHYELVIVDNQTAPEIPAAGVMEPLPPA